MKLGALKTAIRFSKGAPTVDFMGMKLAVHKGPLLEGLTQVFGPNQTVETGWRMDGRHLVPGPSPAAAPSLDDEVEDLLA